METTDIEEIFTEAQAAIADPGDFIGWLYDRIDEGDDWVGETCEAMACPIHEYLTDVTGSDGFQVEGAVINHRAIAHKPMLSDWVGEFVDWIDEVEYDNGGGPVTAHTALAIMLDIIAGNE